MPQRAKSICRKTGCNALIDKPGYCPDHKIEVRKNFKKLDDKKTPEQKKFYWGWKWKTVSKLHREKEPLCRQCKKEGKITLGNAVHHNPELNILLSKNLNPYSSKYLETICTDHHLKELRLKRKSK